MQTKTLLAAALALSAAWGAAAEDKIYRCGQTYQQVPCEQGQAIDASDTRTEAQRRDARAAVKADQQQAKDLVAERREREKAIKPQREPLTVGAKPAEAAASAPSSPPHGHPKKKHGKDKAKPELDEPKYMAPPTLNDGK
ncbi:MAG TPA: hypothetical protein VGQ91_13775 [Ideonella sp.]|jgi:hypothetical protein|nr:hypothetical protein [Ideonella sp.]